MRNVNGLKKKKVDQIGLLICFLCKNQGWTFWQSTEERRYLHIDAHFSKNFISRQFCDQVILPTNLYSGRAMAENQEFSQKKNQIALKYDSEKQRLCYITVINENTTK